MGSRNRRTTVRIPIVGTQDDGAGYGGTFDALNIFDLAVHWNAGTTSTATLALATSCRRRPSTRSSPAHRRSRDCLPQPGIVNPAQYLDILSYRQRPTWRLAYRNFKNLRGVGNEPIGRSFTGCRRCPWYEIRRSAAGRLHRFINRARMLRATGFTAGWAQLRRIRRATWLWAIAWLTGWTSSQASATPGRRPCWTK